MTDRLYFAYGSNLFEPQMADRCPEAELVGRATLRGYRFIINDWGVASIVKSNGGLVWGLLWAMTEGCEATLDVFEGVEFGHYTKHQVRVQLRDEMPTKSVECLTYICRNKFVGRTKPDYLDTRILPAALNQRFPQAYIANLKRFL